MTQFTVMVRFVVATMVLLSNRIMAAKPMAEACHPGITFSSTAQPGAIGSSCRIGSRRNPCYPGLTCCQQPSPAKKREGLCHGSLVRLVEGVAGVHEGRVEIRLNEGADWGTVCDDSWDIEDGHAVCRMLGYSSAQAVYDESHFGAGPGLIVLSNLGCDGYESQLTECEHDGWGSHYCDSDEIAGVTCTI